MHSFELILIVIALWAIPWKIYAVWLASRNEHRIWFLILLFANTAAILEIIYIFKVLKKTRIEVDQDWREGLSLFKAALKRK